VDKFLKFKNDSWIEMGGIHKSMSVEIDKGSCDILKVMHR